MKKSTTYVSLKALFADRDYYKGDSYDDEDIIRCYSNRYSTTREVLNVTPIDVRKGVIKTNSEGTMWVPVDCIVNPKEDPVIIIEEEDVPAKTEKEFLIDSIVSVL